MSYHGMGTSTALSVPLKSLTVQAPLQLQSLPTIKGSIRLDGPVSRRIEKASGQQTLGISVPAGLYKLFFRPSGGRYSKLGEVRVPKSGSVTFDASGARAVTAMSPATEVDSATEGAKLAPTAVQQMAPAPEDEVAAQTNLVQRMAAPQQEAEAVSPSGGGFVLPGASAEPEGGGEAEFVYEPDPDSGIQPREPGGLPAASPSPSGGGGGGAGPSAGPGGASTRKEPSEAVPAEQAPPADERPAWVPWAIGAGVVAAIGIGAWWLTR